MRTTNMPIRPIASFIAIAPALSSRGRAALCERGHPSKIGKVEPRAPDVNNIEYSVHSWCAGAVRPNAGASAIAKALILRDAMIDAIVADTSAASARTQKPSVALGSGSRAPILFRTTAATLRRRTLPARRSAFPC